MPDLKPTAWYVRNNPKQITTSLGMANAWDEGGHDVVPLYKLPTDAPSIKAAQPIEPKQLQGYCPHGIPVGCCCDRCGGVVGIC